MASWSAGRSDLVRLALRLIVEKTLECEVADALGRERYARGDGEKAGYRNGYRTRRVKTAESAVEYTAPQVRDTAEPFVSGVRAALSGRTQSARGSGCRTLRSRAIDARRRGRLHRRTGQKASVARGIRADYAGVAPSALACFEDDFEAWVAHLRLPVTHRRVTRTTNLLERLFAEERRRLKIVPNGFGEKPVLKLMFGALIRAAERWRGRASPSSSFVSSPRCAKSSTTNTRPRSYRQHGHPNRAFPPNLCLDRRRRARIRYGALALLWQNYSSALVIGRRQCGHRLGGARARATMSALRMAGSVGCGGPRGILFSPLAAARRRCWRKA